MPFHKPEKELPDWIKLTPLNGVIILIASIAVFVHSWIMGDLWETRALSNDPKIQVLLDKIAEAA